MSIKFFSWILSIGIGQVSVEFAVTSVAMNTEKN